MNRVVSTILTVLGYVVFLGALVAVMAQWLDGTIERLEQGLTPFARTFSAASSGPSYTAARQGNRRPGWSPGQASRRRTPEPPRG